MRNSYITLLLFLPLLPGCSTLVTMKDRLTSEVMRKGAYAEIDAMTMVEKQVLAADLHKALVPPFEKGSNGYNAIIALGHIGPVAQEAVPDLIRIVEEIPVKDAKIQAMRSLGKIDPDLGTLKLSFSKEGLVQVAELSGSEIVEAATAARAILSGKSSKNVASFGPENIESPRDDTKALLNYILKDSNPDHIPGIWTSRYYTICGFFWTLVTVGNVTGVLMERQVYVDLENAKISSPNPMDPSYSTIQDHNNRIRDMQARVRDEATYFGIAAILTGIGAFHCFIEADRATKYNLRVGLVGTTMLAQVSRRF